MAYRHGPGAWTCRRWERAIPLLLACMAWINVHVAAAPAPMWAFVIVHLDYTAQVELLLQGMPDIVDVVLQILTCLDDRLSI